MAKEARTQTPLRSIAASEDKKFLCTTGINTEEPSGLEDGRCGFDAEHSNGVLNAMSELRAAGQLIDLVLVDAVGARASAHRIVVAAGCSGFEQLVAASSYAGVAKKLGPIELHLKLLHPALEAVKVAEVDILFLFIYTGTMSMVAPDRVPAMLVLCSMFGARGGLTERFRAMVTPLLAAQIFNWSVGSKWDGASDPSARAPALEGLLKLGTSLLTRSFPLATRASDSLLSMDERTLKWLIRSDALQVRDEADVFDALLNWAESDNAARAAALTLDRLFSAVRFKYMTPEAISKVSA